MAIVLLLYDSGNLNKSKIFFPHFGLVALK